jgi:hypothetical protein
MRKCSINIKDKDYDLQMTRESIVWLEGNGFDPRKFEEKPLTYMNLLWQSAFIANHKDVNPNLALKLMDSYQEEGGDISEIINFVVEEYQSFISALSDTQSKSKKKATIQEI